MTDTKTQSKQVKLVSCRSFVYSHSPSTLIWLPIWNGCSIGSVSHSSWAGLRSGFLSLWWTCRSQVRTSAPRLYINSRRLILFGNESLYYWFWLRLYIRLQFVPHPSLSKAHYIKPTIRLRVSLTICACEWKRVNFPIRNGSWPDSQAAVIVTMDVGKSGCKKANRKRFIPWTTRLSKVRKMKIAPFQHARSTTDWTILLWGQSTSHF